MTSKFDKLCFRLLKETPDYTMGKSDTVSFDNNDAEPITFVIHRKTGEYVWAKTEYAVHSDLVYRTLTDTWEEEERGILFDENLGEEALEDMRKYSARDTRTLVGKFIGGRIWLKEDVIAFWNTEKVVKGSIEHVKNFMLELEVEPSDFAFDFIDRGVLVKPEKVLSTKAKYELNKEDEELLDQLFDGEGGTKDVDRLSDEEVQKLLKMQHINPEAKKILRKKSGYQKSKLPFGWNVFSRLSESNET